MGAQGTALLDQGPSLGLGGATGLLPYTQATQESHQATDLLGGGGRGALWPLHLEEGRQAEGAGGEGALSGGGGGRHGWMGAEQDPEALPEAPGLLAMARGD